MTTREYREYQYGQLLAVSDPRLEYWSDESTATAAEPIAGRISALTGTSSVQWSATGEQDSALYVRCQTGGYAGRGATVATHTGTNAWRGWDPPYIVQGVEAVAWDTSLSTTGERAHPRMTRLPDDRIVLVCEDTATSGQTSIIVSVRSATGTWGAELTLTTLEGDDAWPDVAVTATEPTMVRVYALVHDAATESSQVWMWEASVDDDLSDSASWSTSSHGVLAENLAWADEADTVPTRLRVALGSGSGLLLVQARAGRVAQFATRDDGYTWDVVGRSGDPSGDWGSIGTYDMIRAGGAWVVAGYNTDSTLRTTTLANPWSDLEDRVWREVHEPTLIASDVVLMAEDGTTVWMLMPDDGGAAHLAMMWRSPDGGITWQCPAGSVDGVVGTSQSRGASLGVGTTRPAMVWLGSRALLVAETPNATGYVGSLLGVRLGGWTTLPVPARSLRVDDSSRRAWSRQWWAHTAPASAGLTATPTGTPTTSWVADASYRVQTDGGERLVWSWTPAGVEYGDAVIEACVDVDAGEAKLYAEVTETGGSRYIAWLTVSSTTATLVDGTGPTTKATQALTGIVAVRLVVRGAAVKAWYRQVSPSPGDWTAIGSGTLSAAGGSGAVIEVSTEASADVYWWWVASYHADSNDPLPSLRGPQTSSWSTPRDVIGRGLAAPILTDANASITAIGGPLRPGDTWSSDPDAYWTPRRLIASSPMDVLRGWRSTGVDDEIVAWKLGEEATSTVSPIWALHFRGDAQALHVAWHDGTSWGDEAAVTLYELVTMERFGRTLVGVAGAARDDGTFVAADELRGGMVVDGNDICRRILRNSEGVLHGSTSNTWQMATIEIDADNTEETGSQTWRIVWPEVVALLEAPATAKGIRVRVGKVADVRQTPTGYHAGVIGVLGPAHLLGLRHERDTVETTDALVEVSAAQAGPEVRRVRQTRRRVVEISWQRTHDRIAQIGAADAAAPDYITPWSGGRAGYSRGALGGTLRALVERCADGRPVLYVPSYDREAALAEGVEVHRTGRANGAILGQIAPQWRIEHAGYGDEQRDATVRLGSLRLTELPQLQDVTAGVVEQSISPGLDGPI